MNAVTALDIEISDHSFVYEMKISESN